MSPLVFTTNASSIDDGAQISYPAQADRGLPGQIATSAPTTILTGANETGSRLLYGVPLAVNGSGQLPNSVTTRTTAGAILGISARTAAFERTGPDSSPAYADGIPDGRAVNILTRGVIYLDAWEAIAIGTNPAAPILRYFKSGTNIGRWGVTASAGNSLLLAAGGWAIRKAAAAGGVVMVEINTPAALTFTAD